MEWTLNGINKAINEMNENEKNKVFFVYFDIIFSAISFNFQG